MSDIKKELSYEDYIKFFEEYPNFPDDWGFDEAWIFAKHFFELGMAVSNPVTAADRGTAEEIIINLKRIEKDYHIDLTKEMEWLRNKVKTGE